MLVLFGSDQEVGRKNRDGDGNRDGHHVLLDSTATEPQTLLPVELLDHLGQRTSDTIQERMDRWVAAKTGKFDGEEEGGGGD